MSSLVCVRIQCQNVQSYSGQGKWACCKLRRALLTDADVGDDGQRMRSSGGRDESEVSRSFHVYIHDFQPFVAVPICCARSPCSLDAPFTLSLIL